MRHHQETSIRLKLLALTLAAPLAACGGGSGDSGGKAGAPQPTPAPPPVSLDPFQGTAYLKTSQTSRYKDKSYGMERSSQQQIVDVCNSIRLSFYALPAQQVDEAVMAGLDTQITERFFDAHKAATYTTGYSLSFPDFDRWGDEQKRLNGALPPVPPNCSLYAKVEIKQGYLWRDGVYYSLNYKDSKAVGNSKSSSLNKLTLASEEQVQAMPNETHMGERCHKPQIPLNGLVAGDACLWNRYPMVSYLNWPWSLAGNSTLGSGAHQLERQQTTLAIERGKPIDAAKLSLPPGFSVTMLQ
ncbi:hypothetical protein [Paucibacter sp. DJ2R-2]|uniref:hypothetical protein n=1 Tax=Paucibacter sp. DJ2R-2 TaxID=2893558 RepID=UPI0021E4592C|nr:hypothetical protein [Paucibacter sp. DJ2R-2]MCV2422989.1 hypothetical protein [Paucibacter sp. DJ4R-1]MCV2440885.1 hypothetical protein [Paucibacter sp. DJ2R-2]